MPFTPNRGDQPSYLYIRSLDTLLIGFNHQDNPKDKKEKTRQFLERLNTLDHLLMEENSCSTHIERDNYEALALTHFRGPIYFLDNTSDDGYVTLGSRYGCPPLFGEVYSLCIIYAPPIIQGRSFVVDPEKLHHTLTTMEGHPYKDILSHRASPNFDMLLRENLVTWELIPLLADIYMSFLIDIRDYEIYGPRSIRLCSQLSGKKGITIGAAHIPNLEKYLTNGVLHRPHNWSAHLEMQYPDLKNRIAIIQDFLLSNGWTD